MKKIISIILCVILVLSLCACGNKNEDAQTNNTKPITQDTKPSTTNPVDDPSDSDNKPEETKPEETIPDETDEPVVDNNHIKLTQFKDANELFAPFEGKIKNLFGNVDYLTFYADGGIHHVVKDDIGQKVMHKFDIGEVDKIIFYYEDFTNIVGRITSEYCIYTKPNDDGVYLSITDKSEDYTNSRALTIKLDCLAEDILFALRDVDEVFVVCEYEGQIVCLHYDVRANERIGGGIIKGVKEDDSIIDLKMLCSDGYRAYAIDTNDTCRLVETYFGDLIDEDDGEYFVHMYDDYYFENAQSLVTYEYDSLFFMTNDTNNIHSWRFVSGGEINNVKAKLPEGLTINNIQQTWGADECLVILFDNGQYYLIEEISSFEKDEFVEMKHLDFNNDCEIIDFACEGFDLVALSADGNIYICEDVL